MRFDSVAGPSARPDVQSGGIPLVVELEGTLLATNLTQEAILRLIAERPLSSLLMPLWMSFGIASFKKSLAERIEPGRNLPMRPEVLRVVRDAQQSGRRVYLFSQSHVRHVENVAQQIGGIYGVFASTDTAAMTRQSGALALLEAFGSGGFDFVGRGRPRDEIQQAARQTSSIDVPLEDGSDVAHAKGAIMVAPSGLIGAYVRAMRPHQWAKNLLVFLTILSGQTYHGHALFQVSMAFACFCLAASSAYTINDLLDLPGDRQHPSKRHRPYASGQITIGHGIVFASGLLVLALALSFLTLPREFTAVLLFYYGSTLAYSLVLKRRILIDVVTLASLYAIRVLGGAVAVDAPHSKWLLVFSLFLFLCLALVKRYSELRARSDEGRTPPSGRGYQFEDMAMILPLGAAAGYASVLVMALYVSSPEVASRYQATDWLWLLCPLLLYWISRILLLANRGVMQEDPVVFALRDRISWITGAMTVAVLLIAK